VDPERAGRSKAEQLPIYSSSHSSICAAAIVRFGTWGLSVPALTLSTSATFCFANSFASISVRKVTVERADARFAGGTLFCSNETYQVSWNLTPMEMSRQGNEPSFLLPLATRNTSSCRTPLRHAAQDYFSHRDIFGLVMTSVSNVPKISIEAKPSLAEHEVGRNAHDFQKIILTFPDFDGGFQDLLGRLGI
jgi:hypothetical protein